MNEKIIYGCYQIKCLDQENVCDYEKRFFQLIKVSSIKRFNKSSIALG